MKKLIIIILILVVIAFFSKPSDEKIMIEAQSHIIDSADIKGVTINDKFIYKTIDFTYKGNTRSMGWAAFWTVNF